METKSRFYEYTGKEFRDADGELKQGDVLRNGTILRFFDGKLDGDGEPAVECQDGHMEWWKEGKLHRDASDGPAVTTICEQEDGTAYGEKWENGIRLE